jgi:hypothetical protein
VPRSGRARRPFSGRIEAEEDADTGGDGEGDQHRAAGDDDHHVGQRVDQQRAADAEDEADQAAGDRDHHGLEQELREDVALAGADGHADADLARPLGDRDEHDVHDADAADEQRHRGDGAEQQRHHARRFGCRVGGRRGQVAQVEVVVLSFAQAVALAQQRDHAFPRPPAWLRPTRPGP